MELIIKGHTVLIDDEDYELVSKYHWYLKWSGYTYYARSSTRIGGKIHRLYMHRLILGLSKEEYCDHITRIKHNGKTKTIGYFADKEEAALAYNKKATELFGEFARINVFI